MSELINYENGIILTKNKTKIILSNEYGYLGFYWGYKSFRPRPIRSIWELELLKSRIIEKKINICWDTYQWCLNNFEDIKS